MRAYYFLHGMTRAMPTSFHLNNGCARVYIRPYKPGALEKQYLYSLTNILLHGYSHFADHFPTVYIV